MIIIIYRHDTHLAILRRLATCIGDQVPVSIATGRRNENFSRRSGISRRPIKAVAVDTNLLVALRAIDLLLTPTPSRDHMLLYCPVLILECYHN